MYQNILVPLDKSQESEGVLPLVREQLASEGKVVLLHVIQPDPERTAFGSKHEDEMRDNAMSYLQGLVAGMGEGSDEWRCDVVVAQSAVDGISDYAANGEVDLIMMYTHDRKGLTKMIKGSVAEKVSTKASIDVQVFKPSEVANV
jgi:nucleotide-binding universal stress UspA family protein